MGIDPGTNYMGYGVVEVTGRELRSVVMGAIDLHKLTDPYAKLRRIFDRVGALVDEYAPVRWRSNRRSSARTCRACSNWDGRRAWRWPPRSARDVPSSNTRRAASSSASRAEGRQPKSRWRHWSPAYWGSTTPPRSSTRPTAWPWRCAITSCRAARSTPHWATNAQGAWRRPQGRVGARQQIVGKIPQREPRPRTQTLIRFLRDALPEPFRVHESASPNRHVFRQSSGRCTLFRSVSPADPPF